MLVPALDLKAGLAVHARRGERAQYAPVRSLLAPDAPGDAVALASAYREVLGATTLYIADLDAITGGPAQLALLARVREAFGGALWVDAGVRTEDDARWLLEDGIDQVIVGSETLVSVAALGALARMTGPERLIVSLDHQRGRPLGALGDTTALAAEQAWALDLRRFIVLDFAKIGAEDGPPFGLVRELLRTCPEAEVWAGGGIRDADDLAACLAFGARGAVVGTAVHNGRLADGRTSGQADAG
ncbi:MAG: HisA/HisF-related TIM barrel protein [Gemmatimonadales bacterium]|nr:HisA/HisF-related TIM barrel protein [Gemmatimonadales bacterium]